MKRTVFAASLLGLAGIAMAGNISATYTNTLLKSVQYEWVYSSGTQTTPTTKFDGTRTGGTDTQISSKFLAYCTEIGESIKSGVNTHNVSNLLGSTTDNGGTTGPVTYTATRTSNMQKLWGSFFNQTTNADASAAFQLAVWEIAFDDDLTLLKKDSAGGKFWGVDRGSASGIQLDTVSTLAETWLKDIRTGAATQSQQLLLMSAKGTQDLITPVPEPATMAALGLGVAAVLRRRKK